jgi:serine/threonine protein kinase
VGSNNAIASLSDGSSVVAAGGGFRWQSEPTGLDEGHGEAHGMIGQQVENYRILAPLGVGGMGEVWKAVDVNLERIVALKVVTVGLSTNADLIARFRLEARVQAALNHPNIATLYSFLVWEGKAVMVMEYVEGETLRDMIVSRGAIPTQSAINLCVQALLGVEAAHRQGVVHRDLKPANLMLNKSGVVKVMDFGIAKIQDGARLTRTNTAIGTFCYMAPEQIRGLAVDARSDIYSMGITLYEMLTGRVPFDFQSDFEIQSAHVHTPPTPPMVHNPNIPTAVGAAVMRALAKNPDERFASAGEFIRALPDLSLASAKVEPVPYAKLDDPQSLNLYAYVRNNPILGVDADGHAPMSWGGFNNCGDEYGAVGCGGGSQTAAGMAQQSALDAQQAARREFSHAAQNQNSGSGATGFAPTPYNGVPGLTMHFDPICGGGSCGVNIDATPSGCADCNWIQVGQSIAANKAQETSSDHNGLPFIDGPHQRGAKEPLLGTGRMLDDQPLRPYAVTWTAVAVYGHTDVKNQTFKAIGGISYGFATGSGTLKSVFNPVAATQRQVNSVIQLVNKETTWNAQ